MNILTTQIGKEFFIHMEPNQTSFHVYIFKRANGDGQGGVDDTYSSLDKLAYFKDDKFYVPELMRTGGPG